MAIAMGSIDLATTVFRGARVHVKPNVRFLRGHGLHGDNNGK